MTSVTGLPESPDARLVWLKRNFLKAYSHEWNVQPGMLSYAGTGKWDFEKPNSETMQTYKHETICGDGHTAVEAIDDWYSRLPKKGGYAIIWRVEPELASEMDFDSKITKWRVFSRFCVLESAPIGVELSE